MQSLNYFYSVRQHAHSTLNPWKLRKLIDQMIEYMEEQEKHRQRVAVTELMQAIEYLRIPQEPEKDVLNDR